MCLCLSSLCGMKISKWSATVTSLESARWLWCCVDIWIRGNWQLARFNIYICISIHNVRYLNGHWAITFKFEWKISEVSNRLSMANKLSIYTWICERSMWWANWGHDLKGISAYPLIKFRLGNFEISLNSEMIEQLWTMKQFATDNACWHFRCFIFYTGTSTEIPNRKKTEC